MDGPSCVLCLSLYYIYTYVYVRAVTRVCRTVRTSVDVYDRFVTVRDMETICVSVCLSVVHVL